MKATRHYAWMVNAVKRLLYWKWVLCVKSCRKVSVPTDLKATVLLTAYRKERVRNIEPIVRSALKCSFVEKVIVSNDNPLLRISDHVKLRDDRLEMLDQHERQGCKHRWELAWKEVADYYIVIDDDMFIYPAQLSMLFRRLADRPEVMHGLSGCTLPFRFHEREEIEVDLLFEIYALTREHLKTYFEYLRELGVEDPTAGPGIGMSGDFVVMSRCGRERPMIHDTGFISRCPTAYEEGVATFRKEGFLTCVQGVIEALEKIDARLERPPE